MINDMKRKEFKATYSFGIGDKVIKKSGKKFKSGLTVATVKEFLINPQGGHEAVRLVEDDTVVDIKMLKPLTSINQNNLAES